MAWVHLSGLPRRPVHEPASRSEESRKRLERAQVLARRHGRSVNDVALAYLLFQDFPVFPIVGCRTVEQLHASRGAAALRLTPEEVRCLESGATA